jgi:hypothetical protein
MFKDLKKNFYELLDDKKLENNKIIKPENIKNDDMNSQTDEIISDTQSNKIITVSKKKTSKIETNITNEDNHETKVIKKNRIKKSNNNEI